MLESAASLAGQYNWEQNISFSEIIGGFISEIKSFQVPETSLIEFAETVRKHYKRPYDNFEALKIRNYSAEFSSNCASVGNFFVLRN